VVFCRELPWCRGRASLNRQQAVSPLSQHGSTPSIYLSFAFMGSYTTTYIPAHAAHFLNIIFKLFPHQPVRNSFQHQQNHIQRSSSGSDTLNTDDSQSTSRPMARGTLFAFAENGAWVLQVTDESLAAYENTPIPPELRGTYEGHTQLLISAGAVFYDNPRDHPTIARSLDAQPYLTAQGYREAWARSPEEWATRSQEEWVRHFQVLQTHQETLQQTHD